MSQVLEQPQRRIQNKRYDALDGFRGTLLLLFMALHFGVAQLVGVWTAISMFFTVSGFLITRILLREHSATGRLGVARFYRRRAERLLPALLALIVGVGTWALLFASDPVRKQMKGDILASAGFVMNWRLIVQEDEYFGNFAAASFFRHVWTLAVEEQFYVLSPLLIALLIAARSQRLRMVVLSLAMVFSTWQAARIGVDGLEAQARVYYGTDTRMGAIVAGVAVAFLVADGWRPPRWLLVLGGPLMLGVYVLVSFTAEPMSAAMFERGGLLGFTIATAILVIVVIDDRSSLVQQLFSLRWMVWVGVRAYGIYLYHWPIKLWLDRAVPHWHIELTLVVGFSLTLALAALSYRFLEEPIIRGGVRSLLPKVKPAITLLGSLALVVALAVAVGAVPASSQDVAVQETINLVDGTPEYVPEGATLDVAVIGDSVPYYLAKDFPTDVYSDLNLVNLARPACGLIPLTLYLGPGAQFPQSEECAQDHGALADRARGQDAVVMMGSSTLGLTFKTDNGDLIGIDDERFKRDVVAALDAVKDSVQTRAGSQLIMTTVPCRDPEFRGVSEMNEPLIDAVRRDSTLVKRFTDPVEVNDLLREWAWNNNVVLLDLYEALGCEDGFKKSKEGRALYRDFFHFSAAGSHIVWTWLAPNIRTAIAERTIP